MSDLIAHAEQQIKKYGEAGGYRSPVERELRGLKAQLDILEKINAIISGSNEDLIENGGDIFAGGTITGTAYTSPPGRPV